MTTGLSATDVCRLLDLTPNVAGGSVRVTFTSSPTIAPGGLPAPFAEGRPLASALHFLVTLEAPAPLHRIRGDRLYHYYLGDLIEPFVLHGDGTSERVVLGPDPRGGQRVHLRIPGNTFHTARVTGEWPGVIPVDVEIGGLEALTQAFPGLALELRSIAESA